MGLIFKDAKDDQTEAMYEQIHLGNTWQWRYARVKWTVSTILITTISVVTVAVTDYFLIKYSNSAGIIGWIFG